MAALNQKAMETMFERINAIIANNGKTTNKENNPPALSNSGNSSSSGTKRNRKKCRNCGKLIVFHKPTACLELEANAGKRWPGWKSVKDTADAAN